MKIFFILIALLNFSTVYGQEKFINACEHFVRTDVVQKHTINALKAFFNTKDCSLIAKKISTLKSFHEFIPPSHMFNIPDQSNLLFPWTDDFPYLYGLKSGYKFEGRFFEDPNSMVPNLDFFAESEMYRSLDIFSEFTNLTVVSIHPSYAFFHEPDFNVCQLLKKLPHLKIITIESKLLLNPEIDSCLSKSQIEGVILRDHFEGFQGPLPKTRIIGIEFYKGNLNHLAQYYHLQYLGISKATKVLRGVEAFTQLSNITHFSMNINAIQDISEIGKLINLTYLNLTCIDDEENILLANQGCKNGQYLSNTDFLNELTWLEHLNLSFSNVGDVSNLSNLINLKYLKLRGNNITDFALSLPNLTYLDLSGNKLEGIQNLKTPELKFLNLSGNKIKDFLPIRKLKKLEYLNLSNNTFIGQIPGVIFPTSLRGLNLNGGGGSRELNIREFKAFTSSLPRRAEEGQDLLFETLFHDFGPDTNESIKNNCSTSPLLSEVPDLSHLKQLEMLALKNNKLTTTPYVKELFNLKYLTLARNHLSELTESLLPSNLSQLDFSANQLPTFPDISSLQKLRRIELRSNRIITLDNLKTISNSVMFAGLENNLITDLRPIDGVLTPTRNSNAFPIGGNPFEYDSLGPVSWVLSDKLEVLKTHQQQKCPDRIRYED